MGSLSLNVIGIIVLLVILAVGTGIKIYTKKKLSEMDGLNTMFIAKENDERTVVGYQDRK